LSEAHSDSVLKHGPGNACFLWPKSANVAHAFYRTLNLLPPYEYASSDHCERRRNMPEASGLHLDRIAGRHGHHLVAGFDFVAGPGQGQGPRAANPMLEQPEAAFTVHSPVHLRQRGMVPADSRSVHLGRIQLARVSLQLRWPERQTVRLSQGKK